MENRSTALKIGLQSTKVKKPSPIHACSYVELYLPLIAVSLSLIMMAVIMDITVQTGGHQNEKC